MQIAIRFKIMVVALCLSVIPANADTGGDKTNAILAGESLDETELQRIISTAIKSKDLSTLRIAATSKNTHTRIATLQLLDNANLQVKVAFLHSLLRGGETWREPHMAGGEGVSIYHREVQLIVVALQQIGVVVEKEKLSQADYRTEVASSLEKLSVPGKK